MEALKVAEKHEAAERSRWDWIGLTMNTQCDIMYVGEKWTRVKGEQSQTQHKNTEKNQSCLAWKHSRYEAAVFRGRIVCVLSFYLNQLFKNFNSLCHSNRMKSESSSTFICRERASDLFKFSLRFCCSASVGRCVCMYCLRAITQTIALKGMLSYRIHELKIHPRLLLLLNGETFSSFSSADSFYRTVHGGRVEWVDSKRSEN